MNEAIQWMVERGRCLAWNYSKPVDGWRWVDGRLFDGRPCPPCPNCGDVVMWYREYCWRYSPVDGHIEHGKKCERCWHSWNSDTGEIWYQGDPLEKVASEWNGIFCPDKLKR